MNSPESSRLVALFGTPENVIEQLQDTDRDAQVNSDEGDKKIDTLPI
ncbi:MAG: hypothetical protein ACJAUP_001993 [Cellvibrionaceae bacterium]|jgi:hypothetical protein